MRRKIVVFSMILASLVLADVASATWPTLHVGSKGRRVRDAQWLMRGHNRYGLFTFHHRISGYYGKNTAKSTRQAKYRLGYPTTYTSNGKFGPKLYAILTGQIRLTTSYKDRRARRLALLRRPKRGIVQLSGACRSRPPKAYVLSFVRRVSAVYRRPLTCVSGTRYSYVLGTGRKSMHVYGAAADIATLSAYINLVVGQDALIAAGMPASRARRTYGPTSYGYWVKGVNILFHTFVGGNHWNHVHVGLWKLPPTPSSLRSRITGTLPFGKKTSTVKPENFGEAASSLEALASGIGAWNTVYHYGMSVSNDRVAAGIHAFKLELINNGFSKGIDPKVRGFGNYARDRTKDFQRSRGLNADGTIGPLTARLLFQVRARRLQSEVGMPNDLLCRQKTLESANDPVAQGVQDSGDEGLMQVHLAFHPAITRAQAWDPGFILPWAVHTLQQYRVDLNSWDGAVAAWNVGEYYARRWVNAGKPDHGLVVNGIDYYTRAYRYVKIVKESKC